MTAAFEPLAEPMLLTTSAPAATTLPPLSPGAAPVLLVTSLTNNKLSSITMAQRQPRNEQGRSRQTRGGPERVRDQLRQATTAGLVKIGNHGKSSSKCTSGP